MAKIIPKSQSELIGQLNKNTNPTRKVVMPDARDHPQPICDRGLKLDQIRTAPEATNAKARNIVRAAAASNGF